MWCKQFKAFQPILTGSPSMYTRGIGSGRPAVPPVPPPKRLAVQQRVPMRDEHDLNSSPRLEHRTRDRHRRKTRVPSRTALRKKGLSPSSSYVFDTSPTPTPSGLEAAGSPATSTLQEYEKVVLPTSSPPSFLPPSPSPSPPPPLPATLPPSFSLPLASGVLDTAIIDGDNILENDTTSNLNLEQDTEIKTPSDSTSNAESQSMPDLLAPSSPSSHPTSAEVMKRPQPERALLIQDAFTFSSSSPHTRHPFVSSSSMPDKVRPSSASSFSSRLRQIRENREKRAMQRKPPTAILSFTTSPTPALSNTEQSLEHLPEYLDSSSPLAALNSSLSLDASLVPSATSLAVTSERNGSLAVQAPLMEDEKPPVVSQKLNFQLNRQRSMENPAIMIGGEQEKFLGIETNSICSPESTPQPSPKFAGAATLPAAKETYSPKPSPRPQLRTTRADWEEKRYRLGHLLSEPLPLLGKGKDTHSEPTEAKVVEEKKVISEVEYDEKNSLSESLPSLPETPPPELPTSPPPLIPTLLPGEEASLPVSLLPPSSPSTLSHCPHPDLSTFLPPSFRLSNQRYSLPSSTYKSHSLDTSEVNQGAAAVLSSSEAESSTPDPTSGRLSPQSPQRVRYVTQSPRILLVIDQSGAQPSM